MINSQHRRIATATAILALAAGSATVPAAARPLDPDPAPPRSSAFPDSPLNCPLRRDRKSTRLNSSHVAISYAVFCLKKKKNKKKKTLFTNITEEVHSTPKQSTKD